MEKKLPEVAKHTALILILSTPFMSAVFADINKKENASVLPDTQKNLSITKSKVLAEKRQQLVTEAAEAVSGTQKAVEALEKNDPKTALSILQTVSGKLDIILAKAPSLALIPADIETDYFNFTGDSKAIKQELKKADDLLDSGKIQDARQILSGLASELSITVTNIPIGSFPVAIKEAVALIDAGKTEEAANTLNEVLGMLVKTTETIPLPILSAEALLNEASAMENKKDLSKEKSKEEIMKLTSEATNELQRAELLGYGTSSDYKTLYASIDDIKKTLHSDKSQTTWERVKQTLSELKNKLIHSKK
ncbi:YfdX family protein [Methylobacter tundripaludum]|uniref:YfdX family protein n=1 Tax=Methylobacter tundripaludum TaxID=173365 RepID=UPI000691EB1C|nr:YfdX family protein [Methylobacter tundripaludum]